MRWILPLLTFCFLFPFFCYSQEYSYTHYDISDGLAGSTVYCIAQDKEGFLWMGTETGVSRFDGTHFRNFTTKDGLPDVEVLEMFGDSYGRMWMAPFRKSVCYYFKGKIHNQENDTLLAALRFKGNVENVAEDSDGNLLIQESSALHLIEKNGHVSEIDSIHGVPIRNCHAICKSSDGHFLIEAADSLFYFSGKSFRTMFALPYLEGIFVPNFVGLSSKIVVWHRKNTTSCVESVLNEAVKWIPFHFDNFRHVSFSILDDTVVCSNESTGTTLSTMHSDKVRKFLDGVEVSRTFRDDEGNLWFSTIGRGLYRLNSDEFKHIDLKQTNYEDCAVNSIKKIGKELLVGSSRNSIFRFQLPEMRELNVQQLNENERKRVLFIDTLKQGRMVYGTDFTLDILNGKKRYGQEMRVNVKAAHLLPDGKLLLTGAEGLFRVDLDRQQITDTIWKERTTTIYYHDDTIYIGTLNGLYRKTKDGRNSFMGKTIPFLRKRIASIVESSSGVLWIASYDDAGIIGVKDGRVVRQLDQQQGLTSDICRTLAVEGKYLWVGTDKGLNRIDLSHPDQEIMQYTANDGLGSNVINTIFLDSPMVFAGTPAGLSYFDETKVDPHSGCRFHWLDITSAGKSRIGDSMHLELPYRENNIRFDFAGISYKSVGKIIYKYRLLGLDTAWKYTRETFLDYPTLPSGPYELQIAAINKFNVPSPVNTLAFTVAAPFWRTPWFLILSAVVLFLLAWTVVTLRIRHIRNRQEEEKALVRKMNETEHMALQAQMNPHFIFNCLNSIQQYIFDQNILAANKYLTGFSKLIRATLNNSSQPFIPLEDEVRYLSTYLSLEKLRFKDKMDYSIEVASEVDTFNVLIPPMLVQPYVENCMRHGLRHKLEGKGYIRIAMKLSGGKLMIVVEDNGIGREKAAGYKTVEHIEYQSKGMSLTAERIGLMNSLYGDAIGVEILDLKDQEGRASGTRVVMRFPANYDNDKLNDL